MTGEVGVSREPLELRELRPELGASGTDTMGARIRLGDLLHEDDRWWPAGVSEPELIARLEFLALQLAVKGRAHYRREPGVAS